MSSRRPVSRFRHIVPVKKSAARDPRFGQRSGKFNPAMFKKAYSFIDEMKVKEKAMVEKELRKTKNPERKSQLHKLLQKMVYDQLLRNVLYKLCVFLWELYKCQCFCGFTSAHVIMLCNYV